MPSCGSQVVLCNLPVRFDTYRGCSHGCAYCFATRSGVSISQVRPGESVAALKRFIAGERGKDTCWCDWDIPLHWGGMSDPFQPAEASQRRSLEALALLADTGYPVVISTKGALLAAEPYLGLLKQCNAVVQVSLVAPELTAHEPGAPGFEERLRAITAIAPHVHRVVVRVQPYLPELHDSVLAAIGQYADAGAWGVVVEGIKFHRRMPGTLKLGADYVYPRQVLEPLFRELRAACHTRGLRNYVGENRLRAMGDSLTCCGCDGLPGWRLALANLNQYLYDRDSFAYTERMREPGTAAVFAAMSQQTSRRVALRGMSYAAAMDAYVRDRDKIQAFTGE